MMSDILINCLFYSVNYNFSVVFLKELRKKIYFIIINYKFIAVSIYVLKFVRKHIFFVCCFFARKNVLNWLNDVDFPELSNNMMERWQLNKRMNQAVFIEKFKPTKIKIKS